MERLRDPYLQILYEREGGGHDAKCRCGYSVANWRCVDCIGSPPRCASCCRDEHTRDPFHRVEVWSGTHYTRGSLRHLGVAIHVGHAGELCPASQAQGMGRGPVKPGTPVTPTGPWEPVPPPRPATLPPASEEDNGALATQSTSEEIHTPLSGPPRLFYPTPKSLPRAGLFSASSSPEPSTPTHRLIRPLPHRLPRNNSHIPLSTAATTHSLSRGNLVHRTTDAVNQ